MQPTPIESDHMVVLSMMICGDVYAHLLLARVPWLRHWPRPPT